MHSFDQAALALNEDWGTHLDGKQIQRWSEAVGRSVTLARDTEVQAYEQGRRPASPANAPALLVIGMDGGPLRGGGLTAGETRRGRSAAMRTDSVGGGRVQTREKQGENGSRWREDKVSAITLYEWERITVGIIT